VCVQLYQVKFFVLQKFIDLPGELWNALDNMLAQNMIHRIRQERYTKPINVLRVCWMILEKLSLVLQRLPNGYIIIDLFL
jgi:hypothetical protein